MQTSFNEPVARVEMRSTSFIFLMGTPLPPPARGEDLGRVRHESVYQTT